MTFPSCAKIALSLLLFVTSPMQAAQALYDDYVDYQWQRRNIRGLRIEQPKEKERRMEKFQEFCWTLDCVTEEELEVFFHDPYFDPHAQNESGRTAFMHACRRGNLANIELFSNRLGPHCLTQEDMHSANCIYYAMRISNETSRKEVLRFLYFKKGCPISNLQYKVNGRSVQRFHVRNTTKGLTDLQVLIEEARFPRAPVELILAGYLCSPVSFTEHLPRLVSEFAGLTRFTKEEEDKLDLELDKDLEQVKRIHEELLHISSNPPSYLQW